MKTAPHRLLIVDDSALIRKALCRIFDGYPQIQVVGQAADGREALKLLTEFSPDVVTLDVKMPVMDGLTTLKHLMIQRPTPTVMVSAFTKEGAVTTFDALKFGAVDFVPKPSRFADSVLADQNEAIVRKVLTAADVQIDAVQVVRTKPLASPRPDETPLAANLLVAMGAAEGGYGSLLKIVPCIDRQQSVATIVVLYEAAPYVDAFVDTWGFTVE